jgi:hypothetical protein
MNLRNEDDQGGSDDTAANGLILKCEDKNNTSLLDVMVYNGVWGSWKGWSWKKTAFFVCGAKVRYETYCGGCDDTALNGIRLILCYWA